MSRKQAQGSPRTRGSPATMSRSPARPARSPHPTPGTTSPQGQFPFSGIRPTRRASSSGMTTGWTCRPPGGRRKATATSSSPFSTRASTRITSSCGSTSTEARRQLRLLRRPQGSSTRVIDRSSLRDCRDRDFEGHGTWVASRIAANANGFASNGVAPGVRVASYKVLAAGLGGLASWMLDGLVSACSPATSTS